MSAALIVGLCGAVTACDDLRDPSTPCGSLQLGDAEPGAVVSPRRAPVLAMAGGSDQPFVLHWVCETPESPEDACTLTRTPLRHPDDETLGIGSGRNAVLVTSAGNYVVATDRSTRRLWSFSFSPRGELSYFGGLPLDDSIPVQLLASLRNSDWVIGLDSEDQMVRYAPSEQSADRIAEGLSAPTIAAVGEHHVIGRVSHGNDDQSLYLIPVDEDLDYAHHAPTLLMRGRTATRVVVSPRDEHVSITLGHGDSAQTLVFRIPDGELLDRFDGELVSGRDDLTETVGLRAVSPDGSHLAYKTAAGSIALREIGTNSACLVRSATSNGQANIIGFSAEGKLYFESEFGPGETAVSVWDPATRYFAVLAAPEEGARLAAVPSITPQDALPWAIGIRSGSYMALADSVAPTYLDLDDAVFIPRDDADLWVLASDEVDSASRMNVRRVTATTMPDNALRYGEVSVTPHDRDGEMKDQLGVTLHGPQSACLSTGTPGAKAYACGSAGDVSAFAAATSPAGEDPRRPDRTPEVPDLDEQACRAGGEPYFGNCNGYVVDSCCYDAFEDACVVECGAGTCSTLTRPGQPTTVTCGAGAGFP